MFGERQTRELLGPADPARAVRVAPAAATATDLIHRAEAAPQPTHRAGRRAFRPGGRRRLVLVAATATAVVGAAAVAYPLLQPAGDPPGAELGAVVVPVAYQLTDNPPPAGEHLRDLAVRIAEAPYERKPGAYAYLYSKSWGGTQQGSPEGHWMSYVEEIELWRAGDGPVRQRETVVGIEFPDEESRRYWEQVPNTDQLLSPDRHVSDFPADLFHLVPTDRAELAESLSGPSGVDDKLVVAAYAQQLLPWQTRAAILEILADQPGYVWRGEVTDRLGRPGVAISQDDSGHALRSVLVFDSRTGELLASELVDLSGETPELRVYSVHRYDRTDGLPELTVPDPELGPSPAG